MLSVAERLVTMCPRSNHKLALGPTVCVYMAMPPLLFGLSKPIICLAWVQCYVTLSTQGNED